MPTRGTTPYYSIRFDGIDPAQISAVWLTLSQPRKDKEVIIYADRTAEGFYVHLTQEQTLALARGTLKMQIRFKDVNDEAYATEQWESEMADVLQEGVI